MTNTTLEAPVHAEKAKVQTKPKTTASTCAQTEAPAAPWWLPPSILARDALSTLLNAAYRLDLPDEDNDSNYALRLLGMAAKLVEKDLITIELLGESMPQNCITEVAFNAVALLRAVLVHPDGTFGIERRTWVMQSLGILSALTDLHMNGRRGPEYVATLENVINQRSPLPPVPDEPIAQPATASPAEQYQHGQTPKQIELAFGEIATMANTLRNYLTQEAEDVDLYLANIIACQIGSVADCMNGYDIVGNSAAWSIGQPYYRAGATWSGA